MRRLCVLTTLAVALLAGRAWAADRPALRPVAANEEASGDDGSAEDASQGDGDCPCHHGRGGKRKGDAFFNCNCNGSYKFPVPPLYTYQWPGMYSMKRMTDYHSPWRFPALKPYEDETPVRDLSERPGVRQASAVEGDR